MPVRPASPCGVSGCPRPAVQGGRCQEHARVRQDNRGNSNGRGYGSEWQRTRRVFLDEHPECWQCGQPSTVAHHVVPKERGGSDEPANLAALCRGCHERLHGRKR